jgi:predicted AAA+ superfamily ATPase
LGSASPELLRQGSESLAGRIAFVEMGGFDLSETGAAALRRLWWRGGFPRSFLARNDADSRTWLENFMRTFLERDIRGHGLWNMLADHHGQIWNASEISRSLGEAHTTVKRHLDLLTGALMVRQLQPWHENLAKRQVKSCKIYLRDSGLLHALLGIPSFRDLEGHPKIGASWEGFVIEEIVRRAGERNCYFWATQSGAELDLLVMAGGQRYGVEVKYSDAPGMTKSMRVALEDLGLKRLLVVYPGSQSYALNEKTMVIPLARIWSELPLGAGRVKRAS